MSNKNNQNKVPANRPRINNVVVYLDFDGVLNSGRAVQFEVLERTGFHFDLKNVETFKHFLSVLDKPKIIINTTWRYSINKNVDPSCVRTFFEFMFMCIGLDPKLIYQAEFPSQDDPTLEKVITIQKGIASLPDHSHIAFDDFVLSTFSDDLVDYQVIVDENKGLTMNEVVAGFNKIMKQKLKKMNDEV
jgi:hypothetical protein